jgi:hypothetical protein
MDPEKSFCTLHSNKRRLRDSVSDPHNFGSDSDSGPAFGFDPGPAF